MLRELKVCTAMNKSAGDETPKGGKTKNLLKRLGRHLLDSLSVEVVLEILVNCTVDCNSGRIACLMDGNSLAIPRAI